MELKRITLRTRPILFDRVIQDIQQSLATSLPWLDHSFGRCERLVKMVNGRRLYTPNLYLGKNEYLPLAPDHNLGNYSFFVIDEPEAVSWEIGQNALHKTPFSLIVWVDMRNIDGTDERNTEDVKDRIFKAVRDNVWVKQGGFSINRVYNKAENVFEGFSLDEVDNQFLMSPFCGWRFSGEMWIREECEPPQNYLIVEPDEVLWITDKLTYNVYSDSFWVIR